MLLVLGIGAAFTLWMAMEAIHRGQGDSWLWIIVLFGPVGALVFFFTEYMKEPFEGRRFRPQQLTSHDVREAESQARRLDTAGAWVDYASALRARRSFGRAAEAAHKAVERAPEDLDSRYELGLALLGARRYREAIAALSAVVERDPRFDSNGAPLALARAEEGAGNLEASRAVLESLGERSGRPEFLYQLASIRARTGDRAGAAESLRRIVREAESVPAYLRRDLEEWVRKSRRALRRLEA
jgi:hypothetical protein